jgi:hypothetical protein
MSEIVSKTIAFVELNELEDCTDVEPIESGFLSKPTCANFVEVGKSPMSSKRA